MSDDSPSSAPTEEMAQESVLPSERITWRILIPLILAVGILLGAFVFEIVREQKNLALKVREALA